MKMCPTCLSEHNKRGIHCSKECIRISPEGKTNMSKARVKFLHENPDLHPWKKSSKFKSAPCELVKEHLTNKDIVFIEEWQPLADKMYSIDIAFPDIKFGIEINGNQHYNKDGTLKEYYRNRHNEIVSAGWQLLELHYSIAYNLSKFDTLYTIKEQPDYSSYFEERELRKAKRIIPEARGVKLSRKTDEKWEPYKELVINSGVDFAKFGWVSKISKVLNLKDQNVNGWMKRYLPDFYEEKCFKRSCARTSTV